MLGDTKSTISLFFIINILWFLSIGDSTPTSEMSYSQHTPSTSRGVNDQQQAATPCGMDGDIVGTTGPVLLAQALPRLQPQPDSLSGTITSQTTTPVMVPPPISVGSTCNTPG